MVYPTENFNMQSTIDTDTQFSQVSKALKDCGIQNDGSMLDMMLEDIDILAEAVKMKNERFAALAIERLMSFKGFEGTSIEKWGEFAEKIRLMVTVKEMKEPEFLENILALEFASKVTQHPYRTASVYDTVMLIDRLSDQGKKFEEELAKKAGAKTDNHTAYTIDLLNGKKMYVACSDFKIRIGLSIEERNW